MSHITAQVASRPMHQKRQSITDALAYLEQTRARAVACGNAALVNGLDEAIDEERRDLAACNETMVALDAARGIIQTRRL